ncbi:MAG TPA: FAD-dependent oxidoreductase [Kiritimatiellia bacterium]|nr:FAD-dependent oxidoreductase [Kiritimatiellia bacterium]
MLELDPYRELPNPGETALIEIRPSVAVIGAGIAGLTAARLLAERGYPITVFDKGFRPGGRASTRMEGAYAFDHGCQYFTARDETFRRYVESWMDRNIISIWPARRASCIRGSTTLVTDDVTRYVGVPGMNAIAQHLANGLDVRQGVHVTGISKNDRGWRLTCEPQSTDRQFEILVVAIPSEQAAGLLRGATSLATEVENVAMQPCWSVMAVFDFDIDAPFDAAHFISSPLVWAANDGSKPGRAGNECWVLHASPAWTRDHLDDHSDVVAELLLKAFFETSGIPPVKPKQLRAHRWRFASPEIPLQVGCLWHANDGVGVCGDWCHSARIQGAFLSGLKIAERIIDDRPRSCMPI